MIGTLENKRFFQIGGITMEKPREFTNGQNLNQQAIGLRLTIGSISIQGSDGS